MLCITPSVPRNTKCCTFSAIVDQWEDFLKLDEYFQLLGNILECETFALQCVRKNSGHSIMQNASENTLDSQKTFDISHGS